MKLMTEPLIVEFIKDTFKTQYAGQPDYCLDNGKTVEQTNRTLAECNTIQETISAIGYDWTPVCDSCRERMFPYITFRLDWTEYEVVVCLNCVTKMGDMVL